MNVTIDATGLEEARQLLANIPNGTQKAFGRAINRGLTAMRTAISKETRSKYVVKAKDIKDTLEVKKASSRHLSGKIVSTGSPLDLTKFRYRIKKRGGIYAQVKKGGGGTLPHSFFVTTGNAGLYHRVSRERLPIQREFGPSIPQMIGNEAVSTKIQERGREVFERELAHQISHLLGGGK